MTLEYLMIIASVLLLGGQFGFQQLYRERFGAAFRTTLLFNSLLGVFGALLCLTFSLLSVGRLPEYTNFSAICALLMAFCTTTYTLLGFIMMKNSGMTLFTIFLMMGGMTLPYIYGVGVLEEGCDIFNIMGLITILAGIILANITNFNGNAKNIILGILVFTINGMCSIISKTHQIQSVYSVVSSPDFTFWTSIGKFLLCFAVIPFMKRDNKGNGGSISSKALVCLAAAFAFVPASIFQFLAAKTLPATVLYPIVSGGLIIVSAFIDRIFFKKQISKPTIAGISLCFLGTCLFL